MRRCIGPNESEILGFLLVSSNQINLGSFLLTLSSETPPSATANHKQLPSSRREAPPLSLSNFLTFIYPPLQIQAPNFAARSMWYAVSAPNYCISYPRRPCSPPSLRKYSVSTSLRVKACLPDNTNGAKVEYTPWLIVGLGNPGNKYHGTRHNIGFEMIDGIAKAEGIAMNTIQSKALIGIGSIGEVPILLVKPQAYMNYSGESVGPLAAYYQVPLRHILLVYDEMSLPNGVLRIQPKGGHGYHNGVKSVMGHLDGCREFPRLCVGIGNPPGTMDMKAYLLQRFSTVERHEIDAALDQGVEAVRTLVLNGFDQSITSFNLRQKYKYHKV